jgi:23S rRNA pseudouridine955/2504/2580 synthase
LALVKGAWPANKKVIDQPLHKYLVDGGEDDGERRVKVVAKDDPNGMRSVTLVKIAKTMQVRFGASTVRPEPAPGPAIDPHHAGATQTFTLLEVTIKTGRTHQIRVHLASNGYPIVGNKALQKRGFKRMFLHAWRLQCVHPATQAEQFFVCALPDNLALAWGLAPA